jgi:hypothetical protein
MLFSIIVYNVRREQQAKHLTTYENHMQEGII